MIDLWHVTELIVRLPFVAMPIPVIVVGAICAAPFEYVATKSMKQCRNILGLRWVDGYFKNYEMEWRDALRL